MANHELYVVQGKTLDNIAGTMRAVLGVDKDTPIRFDEVASNDKTEQINADIETQADLIAQIQTALEGKAAGGNGNTEIEEHIYNASLLKENCQHEFRHWEGKKLPKTNYVKSVYFNYFVADSSIETIDYYLDWQKGENLAAAFDNTPNLKTMVGVNTANATSVSSLFNKSGIVSIQEPFDFSNINGSSNMSAFTTAKSLVDVRIVRETWKWGTSIASGVLSNESIQSIIDGLATVETAQTLTLHADVKAKLTETQLATITSKNWNLA